MKKLVPWILVTALIAVLVVAWSFRPAAPELPPGGDFTLDSANGPVSLHDFHGKLVLLYFGYTSCPDVCPTNLSQLAMAVKRLSPQERNKLQVLFISVDPARDTPAKLAEYVTYFDSAFLGVTGTPSLVAKVAKAYGVSYRKVKYEGNMGYLVDHASLTYLVDPQGQLRETLPHAAPIKKILSAIRRWLPGGKTVFD
ncbi:SCO family protein [Thiolapillus sp.]